MALNVTVDNVAITGVVQSVIFNRYGDRLKFYEWIDAAGYEWLTLDTEANHVLSGLKPLDPNKVDFSELSLQQVIRKYGEFRIFSVEGVKNVGGDLSTVQPVRGRGRRKAISPVCVGMKLKALPLRWGLDSYATSQPIRVKKVNRGYSAQ